jgi:hypothetical protein
MKYQITVKNQGQTREFEALGVKELHQNLELYRRQGWEVINISRPRRGILGLSN